MAEEKSVSWTELFFDLVFVVAVTQVSALVVADDSPLGLARALVVFVPLFWTWVGTAILTNTRDVSAPPMRIGVFAVALGGLFLALAVPDAYGETGLFFAVTYWATRLVLAGVQWYDGPLGYRSGRWARIQPNPVTLSVFLTGPLLVAGALLPATPRLAVWAVAGVIDLASPVLMARILAGMHVDPRHLSERFGAFVLIAIGETVVALSVSAVHEGTLAPWPVVAVAVAFAVCVGLWWVYFQFANDAMRHALQIAKVQMEIIRSVLSYGHLAFIAGIIAVAAGLHPAIAEPWHRLGWSGAGLLFGGAAVYLATFGYTRWRMFRQVSVTRLTAAAVVLVLLPGAAYLPGIAAVAGLAIVLTVLNTAEYQRVKHRQR